jgi:polyhydroxyalkanoate synthesis regulator phasin
MLTRSSVSRLALGAALLAGSATFAQAQDSGPLIDALVRKGILTDQEGEELRAELIRDFTSTGAGKYDSSSNLTRLVVTGRVQAQFNTVSNEADNATEAPTNSRFILRRVRIGATADFGANFRGVISHDLVANNLDVAYIRWLQSPDLSFDAGFRKVNFGYEENTSSARLPAIERSPVTRFFVEENNGRRLGAGARRTGVFADGKAGDFFYGAAVTNSERTANPGAAQVGESNQPAFWLNGGLKGKTDSLSYTVGASAGYLPEQVAGGAGTLYATGLNSGSLLVTNLYTDLTFGKAGLLAELLWSDNEAGVGANSWGFHVVPSYMLSDKLQLVGRYSYLDTDGIATRPGDVVPGAGNPVGNPGFETVSELYAGFNYLFKGHDVKFSAGVFYASFDDQIGGAGNVKAESVGLRSQMQVNF